MPARADPASERRRALIVASSEYRDPTLNRLRAPGRDAEALREVLGDPGIGAFEVRTLLNVPSNELLRGIAEFCADSRPTDLLLLYFSCHGLLDDRGQLYYGTLNTERQLLAATSISAQWLNDQLEDCRARRQLLILDCCHSGAFDRGMKGISAGTSLGLGERFEGRGRVVLTASRATEYSFEGDQVLGHGVSSHFTAALVHGLRTGQADRDKDGLIAVDELYSYVFDRTRSNEPRQTPAKWAFAAEGDIFVARSPRRRVLDSEPGQTLSQARTWVGKPESHQQTTPQCEHDIDQEVSRKTDKAIQTQPRWTAQISSRIWALILALGIVVGGVVVVSVTSLTPSRPITSHLPNELRTSCQANTDDSASCKLADGMLVLFRLFHTADEARTDVVNGNEPSADGAPCPPSVPPSETGVICHYSVGSATGTAMFGRTTKATQRFYLSRWTSDAEPLLRGEMSTSDANPQDWATLQADWTQLASMR
jgi:caspase domain-containing protein